MLKKNVIICSKMDSASQFNVIHPGEYYNCSAQGALTESSKYINASGEACEACGASGHCGSWASQARLWGASELLRKARGHRTVCSPERLWGLRTRGKRLDEKQKKQESHSLNSFAFHVTFCVFVLLL